MRGAEGKALRYRCWRADLHVWGCYCVSREGSVSGLDCVIFWNVWRKRKPFINLYFSFPIRTLLLYISLMFLSSDTPPFSVSLFDFFYFLNVRSCFMSSSFLQHLTPFSSSLFDFSLFPKRALLFHSLRFSPTPLFTLLLSPLTFFYLREERVSAYLPPFPGRSNVVLYSLLPFRLLCDRVVELRMYTLFSYPLFV